MWSGALRLRPIKRSSESRNPSVWQSGRLKTTRSVNAVRTARFEYRRWPPRRPFFGGTHAAIASSLSQIVTSPRLLRPRSYSLQFRILYFFLYWQLTRLDFAATMTLPSDLYDGLDPTPAASVLAYTDSCTNASARTKEALERRKAAGLPVGRPKGRATKLMLDDRRAEIVDYLNKGVSKRSVAKILGCSPTTLYSWIRRRRLSGR